MVDFKQLLQKDLLHSAPKFLFILLFLFGVTSSFGQSAEEQLRIDSLKSVVEGSVHDTIKIDALKNWDGIIYRYDEKTDLRLNEQIDSICQKNLETKLSDSERNFYLKNSASAKNVIGLIHKDWGNFAISLSNYLEAEKIFKELGDNRQVARIQSNIGVVYTRQSKLKRAREYLNSSLEEFISLLDTVGMARTYQNIGLTHKMDSNYMAACDDYRLSLDLYLAIDHQLGTAQMYNNLGAVYIRLEKYDMAETYIDSAIILKEDLGVETSIALSLNNKSELLFLTNRLGEAEDLGLRAVGIGLQHDNKEVLVDAYDNLYRIYQQQGKYKQALEAYEKHVEVVQYMEDAEKTKELLSIEFQTEYREKAIADSLNNIRIQNEKDLEIEAHRAKSESRLLQQYYLIGAGVLALFFGFFMFRRFKQSQTQRLIIQNQKEEVELKNKEIVSSITYAKRLQDAILPAEDFAKEVLPQHFIFYQPKDIVAGDFYWIEKVGDIVFVAAADCTGHGVPGAMVSVVCSNALSKAVLEEKLSCPTDILNRARELVLERFQRSDHDVKDGMDISFCAIDKAKGKLSWSGANLPLWMKKTDADELVEIKPNKQPVGQYQIMESFVEHSFDLSDVDTIYLFSDGYADQFGGERRKKFYTHNFKNLLLQNCGASMSEQHQKVEEAFLKWKGDYEQVDDICVIGVKF